MAEDFFQNLQPGPLACQQLVRLIDDGIITGIEPDSSGIDYSSFDLHITGNGYELMGCVKPFKESYKAKVLNEKSVKKLIPSDGKFDLERNKIYVFELAETINPPKEPDYIQDHLHGIATGKSTIGRVDVLVRLIVDGMTEYDRYYAKRALGPLYLEIIPITFNVTVKPGVALSQLRLFWGEPEISLIKPEEVKLRKFLRTPESDQPRDMTALTVNLEISKSKSTGQEAVALKAIRNDEPIPLWLEGEDEDAALDSDRYWEQIAAPPNPRFGRGNSIKLENDRFYILRSQELICLPPDVAVYCKAMDEALGEMRIHYAGFVHPFFGYDRKGGKGGTNLIFEVRGHNMDIFLTQGEILAKLEFYRMSQPAVKIEYKKSPYGEQELQLSKLFKSW